MDRIVNFLKNGVSNVFVTSDNIVEVTAKH